MTPTKKEAFRAGSAGVGLYVAIVVGILVLAATVVFVLGGFSQVTAGFRGETSQKNKTTANGDYRIAQYDKFYDECGAIQANEVKQRTARQQIKQAASADEKQRARINLQALQNTHADLATTYNADSSKEGTQAQFKASDLPFNINPSSTEGTTCAR